MEPVIKVEGLYKKFCRSLRSSMYYGTIDLTRDMVGFPRKANEIRKNEFWALKDINFELRKGETLGLIGQNGCGKTTLLRMLNGIFPPDRGKIYINGRIGALISVGAGFHPQMTGRENIFLNGAILGMSNSEIKEKFSDIVDFAEIGDFLDSPVSTYSSGMYVRLGFAIAIHCHPDILLIDEILAVGDIGFVGKCFNKIKDLQENGTAIILVTHNTQSMLDFCKRGILLNYGNQIIDTTIGLAIKNYEIILNNEKIIKEKVRLNPGNLINMISSKCYLEDEDGNLIEEIESDEPVVFCYEINSELELKNSFVTLNITSVNGTSLILVRNDSDNIEVVKIKKGKNLIKITIDSLNLEGGSYKCMFVLFNGETDKPILDHAYLNPSLIVKGEKKNDNLLKVSRKWQIL